MQADAALLATDNATVGTVIENKRIVELPLNGRNYLQLVSLAPNVSTGFSGQGQASARQGGIRAGQTISVGGQRTNFNHYTLDGVENTDPNFNTFVVMPSIDALQEFKVQTGVYPAEFGRQTTQINVLTKSGTNQYHGTLFEFFRNDKLDATSYAFTSLRPSKDPFKWNQYGFTLGGPVRIPKLFNGKDKLFFMANYESYRKRGSTTALFSLASAAIQGGDFSAISPRIYDPTSHALAADGKTITATPFPGNVIPQNRISAISKQLLEFYHTPTLAGSVNNFVEALARPENRDQFVLRMDYVESSKSTWTGRYSWGDENSSSPGLNLNGTKLLTNFEQYMGTNTRVLSPTVVTETRFGYTRFFNSVGTLLAGVRNVVDELKIPGLVRRRCRHLGHSDDRDSQLHRNRRQHRRTVREQQQLASVPQQHVHHPRQALVPLRRGDPPRSVQPGWQSVWTRQFHASPPRPPGIPPPARGGDAFASFLLGNVTLTEVAAQIASVQYRQTSFYLYFDDVWKITPHLTLSLGLRYENTPPWTDQSGNLMTVFFNAYDTTPNVTDQSRYPVFLRQGKGRGDPYAGSAGPLARTSRWCRTAAWATAWCIATTTTSRRASASPGARLRSGRSAWPAASSTTRTRATPGSMSAATPPGARATTTIRHSPPKPGRTRWVRRARRTPIITTPQAFSMKFDRRTPYSISTCSTCSANWRSDLTLEARLSGIHQPPPRVVPRRQRGGPGTGNRRQPVALSELRTAGAGRRRRQRQLQLAGGETDQALFQRPDRAGGLHLVEIDRRNQRRPHPGQRHAVLAGRKLHALRARPVGLRQPPAPGGLRPL